MWRVSGTKWLLRSILTVACLVAAGSRVDVAAAEDAKSTRDRLAGDWKVTSILDRGSEIPQDVLRGFQMSFEGEKLTWKFREGDAMKEESFAVQVKDEVKPNQIDMKHLEGDKKDATTAGIFELDGDTLKLCLPPRGSADRPATMTDTAKNKTTVITAKRAKP